ncbi:MAG TPA: helix-turn-helix domain-containing protein [Fibrobacteraceae bacterium]|nr:helix-turn-helix domain-containing protein [Fibrobacteraceae bacterium]
MLTTGDLAKLFHVSSQTVINWLDQGRIPFERIGSGPRRIRESDVLGYLKQMQISPDTLDPSMYQETLRVSNQDDPENASGPILLLINREGRVVGGSVNALAMFGRTQIELMEDVYNRVFQLSDAQTQAAVILHKSALTQSGPMEMIWQRVEEPRKSGRLITTPYSDSPTSVGGWVLSFIKES